MPTGSRHRRGRSPPSPSGLRHYCALAGDGSVACWGEAWPVDYGQNMPPQGRYVSLSAGSDHACALERGGSVSCWGADDYGQATPPDGTFVSVSAGGEHTCGVQADGSVVCWGRPFYDGPTVAGGLDARSHGNAGRPATGAAAGARR